MFGSEEQATNITIANTTRTSFFVSVSLITIAIVLDVSSITVAFLGAELGIAKLVLVLCQASFFLKLPFGPIDTLLEPVIMEAVEPGQVIS
jgi:uncharacterized membrane protein required for colicin V production